VTLLPIIKLALILVSPEILKEELKVIAPLKIV
jgi:hypothetical protein